MSLLLCIDIYMYRYTDTQETCNVDALKPSLIGRHNTAYRINETERNGETAAVLGGYY